MGTYTISVSKINPWLLVMLGAPLIMLALPLLVRGNQHVAFPFGAWLLWIVEAGFYVVTLGGGTALLIKSVWGAPWREVRKIVVGLCVACAFVGSPLFLFLGPFIVPVMLCVVIFVVLLMGSGRD